MRLFLIVSILYSLAFTQNLREFVPSTISKEWKSFYKSLPDPTKAPPMPGPDDIKGWKKIFDITEAPAKKRALEIAKALGVKIKEIKIAGVNVIEVTPKKYKKSNKALVYIHGGAYTMYSAKSSLGAASIVADYTGLKVFSIDYTNPPKAKWKRVLNEVVSVVEALEKEGKVIGLFGDSAGGALANGAVLRLRDLGKEMPKVLILWSPWSDITQTGDTYTALKDAEPFFIYEKVLAPSANAYALPSEQKNPYVSPVYGDYSKGFIPTLIQGGTREIFLSNFVRLYQKMDLANQIVKLDLYEGMPHVFQTKLPNSPEAKTALKKMKNFLDKYLK